MTCVQAHHTAGCFFTADVSYHAHSRVVCANARFELNVQAWSIGAVTCTQAYGRGMVQVTAEVHCGTNAEIIRARAGLSYCSCICAQPSRFARLLPRFLHRIRAISSTKAIGLANAGVARNVCSRAGRDIVSADTAFCRRSSIYAVSMACQEVMEPIEASLSQKFFQKEWEELLTHNEVALALTRTLVRSGNTRTYTYEFVTFLFNTADSYQSEINSKTFMQTLKISCAMNFLFKNFLRR